MQPTRCDLHHGNVLSAHREPWLALYGVVAALQPIAEFGRVYAAYGGVFIALALAWGVLVDSFPDPTATTCSAP